MKSIIFAITILLGLTACGDGVTAESETTEMTAEEKARWAVVRRVQCSQLGGSYCR